MATTIDKVIAIDCGGTNLRVAVVDKDLKVLSVRRVPSLANNPHKLYETMVLLMKETMRETKMETVPAIGVSMCGLVVHNQVGRVGNLGIEGGYDFESLFKQDFPSSKLLIANDGNCSALVEAEYGVNKGLRDSAFVTISTGIGLGVIHNGEMIDLPLEGGRLMTEYKGTIYETEFLLSGNGIVHLCAMNDVKVSSAAEFFAGVRDRNPDMMRVYDIWSRKLGLWFGNMQLLFDCQQYALSGGVMKSGDLWITDVERIANASIATWGLNKVVLKSAAFGQDVGIAAAGALAWHALKKASK